MASQSGARPTTLELTESETQLRNLLLGVAAYIDDAPRSEENATGIKTPDELTKEKMVLRWTGGWVRDKLLGVGSHDIDVAINRMTGEHFGLKMLEYLKIPGNAEKHGLDKRESGKIVSGLHTIKANPEASKNLETATIKIMDIDLDLVNLRKETYNEVSRNPQMEFGTAEEDAMRRDATVNAMFYNLNTKQIEDLTARGFEDMAAKIIRTPLEPYQTFKDDPLRVLRLIRFASRLNYTIEPNTATAMGDKHIQEALKAKIKRERVGIELEKMLQGPDPHMALALIDKFGLYQTIFTDPTRNTSYDPVTKYFSLAYDFVNALRTKTDTSLSIISTTLLRNLDEWYLTWICATVMPWADAPKVRHPKSSRPPYHAAYLVAQEGFKAPNKVCDVIAASLNNSEEIMKLVEQCHEQLRLPVERHEPEDATARDTLGMAIRRWGSTWRTQVFFSLVYEIVLGSVSKQQILRQYSDFLGQLTKHDILDAYAFKPLVNGRELASAMGMLPGPWMKDALDEVMAYQLKNPNINDPTHVIEAVKKTRQSELPSRLISRFLSLTIRPLFPQTDSDWKPWKAESCFPDLLEWVMINSDELDIQKNMHLLRLPITHMLHDNDLAWKAKGCMLVTQLMKSAPPNFIQQRGYHQMFAEEIWQVFQHLPSGIPEKESVSLLREVYPALIALHRSSGPDERILDRIVNEGVVSILRHCTNPVRYPELATLVLSQLDYLLDKLMIRSVKHLQEVLMHLSDILTDPFAPAYPPLLIATAKAMQSAIRNGWPRFGTDRAMRIYHDVCKAWLRYRGYEASVRALDEYKKELKGVLASVDLLIESSSDLHVKGVWEREKRKVVKEDYVFKELFDGL